MIYREDHTLAQIDLACWKNTGNWSPSSVDTCPQQRHHQLRQKQSQEGQRLHTLRSTNVIIEDSFWFQAIPVVSRMGRKRDKDKTNPWAPQPLARSLAKLRIASAYIACAIVWSVGDINPLLGLHQMLLRLLVELVLRLPTNIPRHMQQSLFEHSLQRRCRGILQSPLASHLQNMSADYVNIKSEPWLSV